jgi:hypothetical protein
MYTLEGSKCPRIKESLIISKVLTRGESENFNQEHYNCGYINAGSASRCLQGVTHEPFSKA